MSENDGYDCNEVDNKSKYIYPSICNRKAKNGRIYNMHHTELVEAGMRVNGRLQEAVSAGRVNAGDWRIRVNADISIWKSREGYVAAVEN